MKEKILKVYFALLLLVLLQFGAVNAIAATTEILSVTNEGKPGSTSDRHTWTHSGISNDGRYAVFVSTAKLTANDVDPIYQPHDIYLRDRIAGTTTLLTPTGFYGTAFISSTYGNAAAALISGDGNYVALIATRQEAQGQDYVYDLLLIDRVSGDIVVAKEGGDIKSMQYAIDYDGDLYYVNDANIFVDGYSFYKYDRRTKQNALLYSSTDIWRWSRISVNDAGTLVCFHDYNAKYLASVYLLDVSTGNKTLVSKTTNGAAANGNSKSAKISKSGDFIVFHSNASNLGPVPYPTKFWNLFLYDIKQNTVEKLTFNDPQYGYFYPTEHGYNHGIADVSDDGRFIAAVLTDVNYAYRQYGAVLDRQTGKVELLPDGTPANNMLHPVITPDGRYVVSTGITPSAPNGVYTLLYDRYGSNQNFVVDAGPDQPTIQQTAPYGAYATLTGALSAGTCTGDQTYRWTWPEGETIGTNPTIFLPTGTTEVTLDWSGCGGTASDTVNLTVVDSTPPNLTVTGISGTAGSAGWYRSDVSVLFAADDSGSGVAAIYSYTADGVETIVAGASASIPVNGDGDHTLTSWSVDNGENRSTPPIVTTIQIDSIAPAITGAALTQPNANGWYNTDMIVHFSATDTRSGIASVTPDATLATEGAGQFVTGTAVDVAGNRADYSVNGINLDRTPPVITITGVANGMTYNLGLVPQATFTASDSLAGLAESTGVTTGTPDAFGCGTFTYTVTATDKAGNSAASSVTYVVKATPAGTSALIDTLVSMGLLPSQTTETLQATLAKALSGYNSNPVLGDNMMNTFLNQINAALNSGKISSATAALLNNAANYIMVNN